MAKVGLFDFLNSINKKQYLEDLTGYSQFMINRFLTSSTVRASIIGEINSGYKFTDRMHYDFLFNALPKTSEFMKYNMKKEKAETELEYLMKWFNIDMGRAKTYSTLISKEEFQDIISYYTDRGTDKNIKVKGKKK